MSFSFLLFQGTITNEGDAEEVARSVISTILGCCSGGLTALFFNKLILKQKWSYLLTLNGALAGGGKIRLN